MILFHQKPIIFSYLYFSHFPLCVVVKTIQGLLGYKRDNFVNLCYWFIHWLFNKLDSSLTNEKLYYYL